MRFFQSASTLLTVALLGTSALAELTKVPRSQDTRISARDEEELREELAKQCEEAGDDAGGLLDIFARNDVDMGDEDSGPTGTELKTIGLGPCQGIAVVGSYDDDDADGDAVFLAHISATKMDKVNELAEKVKEAKDEGLKNLKATIVLMDPDSYPEDESALGDLLSTLNDMVVQGVNDIGDIDVTEEVHSYDKTASLEIKSDGSIVADV